jgi:hypothetical protein
VKIGYLLTFADVRDNALSVRDADCSRKISFVAAGSSNGRNVLLLST